MMRSRLASLALLAALVSLVFGVAQAGAAGLPTTAPLIRAASDERAWQLTLSPAVDDLALAEISFHGPAWERLSTSSLQLALSGESGDGYDYLAMAAPRFHTSGGPRALVLLVNRPSALDDPVSVRLRLSARRALGKPRAFKLANPFTHPEPARTPALCDLALTGSTLDGSKLRALGSHGASLGGFDAADAVAEAYDVVCGLAYTSAFKQAVTAPSVPPTLPVPTPVPPGCTPCNPSPGTACPLVVQPGICVAASATGARRVQAGAH
jgi:hypothetical protein